MNIKGKYKFNVMDFLYYIGRDTWRVPSRASLLNRALQQEIADDKRTFLIVGQNSRFVITWGVVRRCV